MSMRVCSTPGCPTLSPTTGRCPACAREHDQARGSRQQRGYDKAHDQERARWARIIARTPVPCARCHTPITAGMDWHLDHDEDRSAYLGPSHDGCNLSAGGKASHRND